MKSPGLFSWNERVFHAMCAFICAFSAIGCANDDQEPQIESSAPADGGGVSGGPLTSTLTVYAIDSESGPVISGAQVFLGVGQTAHPVGLTGPQGNLTVSGLDGTPQMISINAAGYSAATWGFVTSSIATIPLE